jgi:kanamycin kinase
VLAGPPPADVDVPAAVVALLGRVRLLPVWRNELGGLTFEVLDGIHRFVKWAPAGTDLDLAAEAERTIWVGDRFPVPEVLALHDAGDDGSVLVTRAMAGASAVASAGLADPARTVALLGEALRALHEALPVEGCPFDWSVEARSARAGILAPPVPPVDRLVVCHGDACAPNTLIDGERWTGIVDLGALGVADRWADLAIATWSLEWNFGPGWDDRLLAAYGIDADPQRTAAYRHLWRAT